MKFLVPNYSCLQNPWIGGYRLPGPRSLCPLSTEFFETPPFPEKFRGTPLHEIRLYCSHFKWFLQNPGHILTVLTAVASSSAASYDGSLRVKCDGTRTGKTDLVFAAERTSSFKSAGGRQFSRLLAAEVCASAVVMLDKPCSDVVWMVLATHSVPQFPPSLPLQCVAVCHHISTGAYCT